MSRYTFLCYLLLLPFLAVASDAIPESAPNCGIQAPPDGAGEDVVHRVLVKVFPRKSKVGADYTGCQTAWIQKGDNWEKFSVMFFRKGQLQTWWSSDEETNSLGLTCRFSNGKLVAKQPKKCYVPMGGLQATFAPGCMAEMIRTGEVKKECETSLEN